MTHISHHLDLCIAKLPWVQHTRRDISYDAAVWRCVTEIVDKERTKELLKRVNKILKYMQVKLTVCLKLSMLYTRELFIFAYSDASYVRNFNLSSQLECIMFLKDNTNSCYAIVWSCHNAKLATRSVLHNYLTAFTYSFDVVYSFKFNMEKRTDINKMLQMYTDISSLFEFMSDATVLS